MNGFEKKRAEALAILLNANTSTDEVILSIAHLPDTDTYFVQTEERKIRIFKGADVNRYKVQIGGTLRTPGVLIRGNTYDGLCRLFNSIEEINA